MGLTFTSETPTSFSEVGVSLYAGSMKNYTASKNRELDVKPFQPLSADYKTAAPRRPGEGKRAYLTRVGIVTEGPVVPVQNRASRRADEKAEKSAARRAYRSILRDIKQGAQEA